MEPLLFKLCLYKVLVIFLLFFVFIGGLCLLDALRIIDIIGQIMDGHLSIDDYQDFEDTFKRYKFQGFSGHMLKFLLYAGVGILGGLWWVNYDEFFQVDSGMDISFR